MQTAAAKTAERANPDISSVFPYTMEPSGFRSAAVPLAAAA
jgi:hypothetical protein